MREHTPRICLHEAVAKKAPFELIAQQGDTFVTAKLDTKTGAALPRSRRAASDRLSDADPHREVEAMNSAR